MQFLLSVATVFAALAVGIEAAATTTFPSAASSTTLAAALSVSGTYDGGMKRFSRNSKCSISAE